MAIDNKGNDPFESLPNVNNDPFASMQNVEHYSPLESAGLGAVQGASLGFADEAEGAARALYNLPGNKKSLPDLYKEYREIARNRYDAAQKENPKSFIAGNLTGAIASPVNFIPGLGEMNLAKAAGLGAAAGLGSSKSDDIKGMAIDTGVGAGIGAAGYGLVKGLTPENLTANADVRAIKGLGGKPTVFNEGVGTAALDAKALPIFGGAEAAAGKLGEAVSGAEQEAIPILNKATEVLSQNPEMTDTVPQLPDKIEELKNMFLKNYIGDDAPKVSQAVDNLSEYWGSKLADVQDNPVALRRYRIALDQRIKAMDPDAFNPANSTDPAVKFLLNVRNEVNDHIGTLIDTASENTGAEYSGLMKKYSQLIKAEGMASKTAGNDLNKPPGMANIGAGDLLTEGIGGALKMAGHGAIGNMTMLGGAGKIAAESITGSPISRLGNIVSARAQSWAASVPPAILKGAQQGIQKGFASNGVQTGIQNIYTTSPEKLQQASQTLMQDPATKDIGNALNSAIQNGDEEAKNKVLWAAEQNPNIRQKFRNILELPEEK